MPTSITTHGPAAQRVSSQEVVATAASVKPVKPVAKCFESVIEKKVAGISLTFFETLKHVFALIFVCRYSKRLNYLKTQGKSVVPVPTAPSPTLPSSTAPATPSRPATNSSTPPPPREPADALRPLHETAPQKALRTTLEFLSSAGAKASTAKDAARSTVASAASRVASTAHSITSFGRPNIYGHEMRKRDLLRLALGLPSPYTHLAAPEQVTPGPHRRRPKPATKTPSLGSRLLSAVSSVFKQGGAQTSTAPPTAVSHKTTTRDRTSAEIQAGRARKAAARRAQGASIPQPSPAFQRGLALGAQVEDIVAGSAPPPSFTPPARPRTVAETLAEFLTPDVKPDQAAPQADDLLGEFFRLVKKKENLEGNRAQTRDLRALEKTRGDIQRVIGQLTPILKDQHDVAVNRINALLEKAESLPPEDPERLKTTFRVLRLKIERNNIKLQQAKLKFERHLLTSPLNSGGIPARALTFAAWEQTRDALYAEFEEAQADFTEAERAYNEKIASTPLDKLQPEFNRLLARRDALAREFQREFSQNPIMPTQSAEALGRVDKEIIEFADILIPRLTIEINSLQREFDAALAEQQGTSSLDNQYQRNLEEITICTHWFELAVVKLKRHLSTHPGTPGADEAQQPADTDWRQELTNLNNVKDAFMTHLAQLHFKGMALKRRRDRDAERARAHEARSSHRASAPQRRQRQPHQTHRRAAPISRNDEQPIAAAQVRRGTRLPRPTRVVWES